MVKIVFATKSCWPGVENSLRSMMSVLQSEFPGHDVSYVDIPQSGFSSNLIHSLKMHPPEILILGGWDIAIRDIATNANKSKTKVFLEWCSPLSQTEMGNEIPLFIDVLNFLKMKILHGVILLLDTDYQVLKKEIEGLHYCPVCMDFNELENNRINIIKDRLGELKCDMFCAPNPRKNLFSQIFALRNFDNLRVFVNYNSREYVESVKRYLNRHEFCSWMTRKDYLRRIQEMDFCSQVTFSESFNMTVAEHMYYEIPVVCSSFLSYVTPAISELAVENPNNCQEIYSKIKTLIDDPSRIPELGEKCKFAVTNKNNINRQEMVRFLGEIFNG